VQGSSTSPTFDAIRQEICSHCGAAPGQACTVSAGPGDKVIEMRSHHRARILAARSRMSDAQRLAEQLAHDINRRS
jgi:hypothetical protein